MATGPQAAFSAGLLTAVEALERQLDGQAGIDGVDPVIVQRLNAVAVRAYAAQGASIGAPPPFPDPSLATMPNASEVCFTVTQMLDAVSVEIFELAMWKTWSAMPDSGPSE
jgi:hypothetical protein